MQTPLTGWGGSYSDFRDSADAGAHQGAPTLTMFTSGHPSRHSATHRGCCCLRNRQVQMDGSDQDTALCFRDAATMTAAPVQSTARTAMRI